MVWDVGAGSGKAHDVVARGGGGCVVALRVMDGAQLVHWWCAARLVLGAWCLVWCRLALAGARVGVCAAAGLPLWRVCWVLRGSAARAAPALPCACRDSAAAGPPECFSQRGQTSLRVPPDLMTSHAPLLVCFPEASAQPKVQPGTVSRAGSLPPSCVPPARGSAPVYGPIGPPHMPLASAHPAHPCRSPRADPPGPGRRRWCRRPALVLGPRTLAARRDPVVGAGRFRGRAADRAAGPPGAV